jgi:hypothetical protein
MRLWAKRVKYAVTKLVMGRPPQLPIDEPTFVTIRSASHSLFRVFQIEEDYDAVVGNYVDLERAVLSLGIEAFTKRRITRPESDSDRRLLSRLLANLLASARAYRDHTIQHVERLAGGTAQHRGAAEQYFVAEYDASLSYRATEALRNYAQHCGLPAHVITYQSRWVDHDKPDDAKLIHGVLPSLSLKHLAADTRFKTSVLAELRMAAKHDYVPLMPMVREYVSRCSTIHKHIRELYQERKGDWFKLTAEWVHKYDAFAHPEHLVGISAVAFGDDGKVAEDVPLQLEYEERLAVLESANRQLINLHKLQVVN